MTHSSIERAAAQFEHLASRHEQWAEELAALPPAFGGPRLDSLSAARRESAREAHLGVRDSCAAVAADLRLLAWWLHVG